MTRNQLPGNPFATEDALYTEDSNNSSVVNALMALAFEQRTATLISLWTSPETTMWDLRTERQRTCGIGVDVASNLLQQILDRLGINNEGN